ncbi:class A sortase [Enterococcus hulanensis]|uniref:Class A sortase n=1 Tax=Enterococcus hulanensis TaxID=2559929 RepID=A0ABU3F460_9ENTE|nr:class A sortase [Enterococcus hulanensis]MDT2601929.1 class A sortase [Enterococcus hulanensis]MDT2611426.1 class A sortase [Enterococcus hulanensis]MDT2618658.1 class A sortase [Enterococcus hulanensis]MDT2630001.1 class A sortase [Enterococcus hulanensis]MDT2657708.1 class A sortase [Enterococcus hulanensis]
MKQTKKTHNLLIILLFIIGAGFICYPIIKNTVTIINIKEQEITETKVFPQAVSENERIELPTAESYLTASKEDINDAVGQLSIPSVKIETPLFAGLHNQELLYGAGLMYPERSIEKDNIVVLGHHLGISDLLLGNLTKVSLHDKIYFRLLDKTYQYTIIEKKQVHEEDIEVLANTPSPQLTLITCDEPTITDQRIVVTAKLEEEKSAKQSLSTVKAAEQKNKQELVRKSFIKYGLGPILLVLAVVTFGCWCIWRYV